MSEALHAVLAALPTVLPRAQQSKYLAGAGPSSTRAHTCSHAAQHADTHTNIHADLLPRHTDPETQVPSIHKQMRTRRQAHTNPYVIYTERLPCVLFPND